MNPPVASFLFPPLAPLLPYLVFCFCFRPTIDGGLITTARGPTTALYQYWSVRTASLKASRILYL
jgi:hypothetical protein